MMVSGILDSKSVVSLFLGFLKISKSVNILKIYCPNINEYCHKITKICEVLSPKRRCERTLPRDPLENFSNLYFIGERKLGFKKTKVNRPFSNRRKPLLSRWVGGWMGGRWFFGSFDFSQNRVYKQDVLIPKMTSKYCAAIRSKVMSNLSSKFWK